MYMPRLRARQHEVLAVRNCATSFREGGVVPILEPVSLPDELFGRRLQDIGAAGVRCDLVLNPSVGKTASRGSWRSVADAYMKLGLLEDHGLAVLSDADADHAAMAEWVEEKRNAGAVFKLDIVHEPGLSVSLEGGTYYDVRWNIAQDRTVPAAYGLPLGGRPVVWVEDPFPVLPRNRDYHDRGEVIFSTRTASFRSAGYIGVSDFLTVGRHFQVGGGPAYAVVIHLTYETNGIVRLRHFCSDSNDTQDDPGGKFLEALDKLVQFVVSAGIRQNPPMKEFMRLRDAQHFPGLGKVKELSMMNHMLVMQDATLS